jgi:putative copper resistance protein D
LIGTVLVGLLTICGIANLLYLAPPAQWPLLASTQYGTLMLAKLALFAAMFGLAAHNRFRLVPALEMASGAGSRARAIKALRRSVSLENLIALGFSGAWLSPARSIPLATPEPAPIAISWR